MQRKIDRAISRAEQKRQVSPNKVTGLKALLKDVKKLADEFKVVENDFASGKVDKKLSKEKIKRIKRDNERILTKFKTTPMKQLLKTLGITAAGIGLSALLGRAIFPPTVEFGAGGGNIGTLRSVRNIDVS